MPSTACSPTTDQQLSGPTAPFRRIPLIPVFEAHTQVRSLDFADCPADLRSATKHYCWELINHTAPQSMRGASTDRLSLPTVSVAFRRLLPFLTWLRVHGITSFDQVTTAGLDRFLDSVRAMESSAHVKAAYLIEVRRLWCYRNRLPDAMRLPATPPWDGEDNQNLLNLPHRGRENATPRIHPDTLQPLLVWSLRFVEDFAEDIHCRVRRLPTLGATRRRLRSPRFR